MYKRNDKKPVRNQDRQHSKRSFGSRDRDNDKPRRPFDEMKQDNDKTKRRFNEMKPDYNRTKRRFDDRKQDYDRTERRFDDRKQDNDRTERRFDDRKQDYDRTRRRFDDRKQDYNEQRFDSQSGREGRKRWGDLNDAIKSIKAQLGIDKDAIRLNKFIANSGLCSRREADELIEAGKISVNGEIITTMGFLVSIKDDVRYNGKRLSGEQKRYVLLNKPKDCITTTEDERGRKTVMDIVKDACRERIYPVGRLDRNTTGVLLLTNDGELAKNLTHPSFGARKIYQVELDKKVSENDLKQLLDGVMLEDGLAKVDDIQYIEGANNKRIIGIEIHSGRNRIVRRMFEHLGYEVERLDRVMFAGLTKKEIARGHWRHLNSREVAYLKMLPQPAKQDADSSQAKPRLRPRKTHSDTAKSTSSRTKRRS
ncbi:MAG: pseudouridine synthase [Bacteroidales bacterium]|jgi:23S rRNA pseudouridine2605 synthase|nr:pseudouridine synthase [Bacteroidales bacterium]